MSTPRSHAGFTFVELLAVIVTLGLLTSLLMPVLARARAKADQTSCISNLRQLGQALQLYAAASHDSLPGPVFALPQPSYVQASQRELAWFLADKLGCPKPSLNIAILPALICPTRLSHSLTREVRPEEERSYLLNENIKSSGQARLAPFGNPTSPQTPPLTLSALSAEARPAGVVAISDADKANTNPTLPGWRQLPCRPSHGDLRNQLFFDGHVAAQHR